MVAFLTILLLPTTHHLSPITSFAEIIERVVAFIDDEAITLTEFRNYFNLAQRLTPNLSEKDAIETLINRRLLLREAKRLRLRGKCDDELINEYIDIKIRIFIKITEKEIEDFYNKNQDRFYNVPLKEVRKDIEKLITEKKVNKRLKKHAKELRKKSYIKINPGPS